MIALAFLLQAVPDLPAAIGRQSLPAQGCAAYLWTRGPAPALVAMAAANPAAIRMSLGGRLADYPRTGQSGGDAGYGFARVTEYRTATLTATLELTLAARPDLTQGAAVTDATLTIQRPGVDLAVLPLGGMVGCAAAKP